MTSLMLMLSLPVTSSSFGSFKKFSKLRVAPFRRSQYNEYLAVARILIAALSDFLHSAKRSYWWYLYSRSLYCSNMACPLFLNSDTSFVIFVRSSLHRGFLCSSDMVLMLVLILRLVK